MAVYEEGIRVLITLNPKEQPSCKEVWKWNGQEAIIRKRRMIRYGVSDQLRGIYYELAGAKSKMGLPFGFLEEHLLPLD